MHGSILLRLINHPGGLVALLSGRPKQPPQTKMKTYILPLAASFLLSSPWFGLAYHFHTKHAAAIEAEAHAASWRAFCSAYGVDESNPEDEQINDYLDTWRGSVEEENALTPEQNNAIN